MLALGPVHIVRDAAKTLVPMRLTLGRQVAIETLVVGLHGGGLPRWLSSSFPNFQVDVVERDGALVSLCRRFLGFQESSNLHLWVGDPFDYLAQTAAACRQGAEQRGAGRHAFTGKRYDLILLDGIDGSGHLSPQYGRLEFVNSVRNSMGNTGVVAMAVPNKDGRFLYQMTQNWRMAFSGRPVLLIHCITSPTTILMTFQDNADRGKANVGSVHNVEEFKDLVRSHMKHYGAGRILFDLTNEVNDKNFRVLDPGQTYDLDAYLPRGHPEAVAQLRQQKQAEGWNAWIRRVTGSYLTPGQRVDLKGGGRPSRAGGL
ncbi:hypothetical protein STCU_05931 [Strigomonas culicis]|uniref:Spermidine synthase n=1 Tax=Strigomonas culicis TaxID=28005 RepID=S9VUX0_9TRYP|nr:hypothetical protein STCU_05931 [Strigomonas culicis]|eukprot:EPY27080.1 hypothetical protein STCU_05931 [Strigomonas culicis]